MVHFLSLSQNTFFICNIFLLQVPFIDPISKHHLYKLYKRLISFAVCDVPAVPSRGNISIQSDGLAVMYSCDVGYTLYGDIQRQCQEQGLGWTSTDPTCGKITM